MTSGCTGRFPLTAAQQGVWVAQRLGPASPLYNAAECVEITGPVDIGVFEEALRHAVTETDALNCQFSEDGREVRQEIRPLEGWRLSYVDLTDVRDPSAMVSRSINEDLKTLVDLRRGPIFSHALYSLGSSRFLWYHRAHHIALDGYGFALFARRVSQLYNAKMAGDSVKHIAHGSLRAVVEEDIAYQTSEQCDEDRDFWLTHLADRPSVVSLGRPARAPGGQPLRHGGRLPGAMENLRAMADKAQATWVEVVLALIAVYVGRGTTAREVVLGTTMMGRLGSVAARVPANTRNILPLRIPVGDDPVLVDVVRSVVAELELVRRHQRYRGEQLRRDLHSVGEGRRIYGPLVNIMPFDYRLDFAGHRAVASNVSAGAAFIEDIAIHVSARSDGEPLELDIDANPHCYRREDVVEHYVNIAGLLTGEFGVTVKGRL